MEFLELGFVIAKVLKRELRDGFQISDLATIALTPEVQAKVAEAFSGISNVASEWQDVSTSEGLTLIRFITDRVEDYLEDQPAA
ncbi:MAG TPA: hypothetical protein VE954_27355 [Oligoflexus sp.]|uniref:hypothetical protein n=1 Tax=Oligoflexus sp. TaxID=1971216 RepID=UPI002D54A6C7|nr:hypothetical protein [Oligoflexus sp.]HYX36842.1 hypothetical protein [Oligoflexus sp.]